jgi:hypothetical protein
MSAKSSAKRSPPIWLPPTLKEAKKHYTRFLTRAVDKAIARGIPGRVGLDEAKAQLGRADLFYLLRCLLGRKDVENPWLFDRCREVQAAPNGHLDVWSRGHYKSSIITYALTIQDILNDAEITVGIFSHTRPIAKGFLRQIKRELETNDDLKRIYSDVLYEVPHRDSPQWSEDSGIVVKRKSNPKEATIEAWGLVDGQPTSKHFRLRVYDDVVTRENVTTPDQVHKTTEAWELSENLGGGENVARYIGTRYSLHDTYSAMLERGAAIPRIYAATHNGTFDGRPVFLTEAEWAEKKQKQSRSTIAAQMLQNPLADGQAVFRVDWLKSYEVRPRTLNVFIMGDPSRGKSATSDNTAFAVVGVSQTGGRYLLDGMCHRMTLSQRWRALKGLYVKWSKAPGVQHIKVGYERYGMQSDDEYFRERMEQDSPQFVIEELSWVGDAGRGGQSKEARVGRLEPDFRNERFMLPLAVWHDSKPCRWRVEGDKVVYVPVSVKDSLTRTQSAALDNAAGYLIARAIKQIDEENRVYDLTVRFIEEYETFPFGLHDDLVDAVSRVYDLEPRQPQTVAKENLEPEVFFDS